MGRREVVAEDAPEYYETAPLTRIMRPHWDKEILKQMGMKVSITEDVGRYVYEEWEKDLYGESLLFEICAIKGIQGQQGYCMEPFGQTK